MSEPILCLEEACSELLNYGEDLRQFHTDHYRHESKFLNYLNQILIEEKNKLIEGFNYDTLLTNVDLMVVGLKKDFDIKMDIFAKELKNSIQSFINLDRGVGLYLSIISKDMTRIKQYSNIFHMLKDPATIIQQYQKNIIEVEKFIDASKQFLNDEITKFYQLSENKLKENSNRNNHGDQQNQIKGDEKNILLIQKTQEEEQKNQNQDIIILQIQPLQTPQVKTIYEKNQIGLKEQDSPINLIDLSIQEYERQLSWLAKLNDTKSKQLQIKNHGQNKFVNEQVINKLKYQLKSNSPYLKWLSIVDLGQNKFLIIQYESDVILVTCKDKQIISRFSRVKQVNVMKDLFTLFKDDKERLYQTILDAVELKQNVDSQSLPQIIYMVERRIYSFIIQESKIIQVLEDNKQIINQLENEVIMFLEYEYEVDSIDNHLRSFKQRIKSEQKNNLNKRVCGLLFTQNDQLQLIIISNPGFDIHINFNKKTSYFGNNYKVLIDIPILKQFILQESKSIFDIVYQSANKFEKFSIQEFNLTLDFLTKKNVNRNSQLLPNMIPFDLSILLEDLIDFFHLFNDFSIWLFNR